MTDEFVPALAVADIQGPVVINGPIHSDGILARGAICQTEDPASIDNLPLAVKRGVYQAGTVLFEAPSLRAVEANVHRKNFPREATAAPDAIAAMTSDGRFAMQDEMDPYRVVETPIRAFYGITRAYFPFVGDPDAVRELLIHVVGVGGATAQGYGAVGEWDVREVEDADPATFGLLDADRGAARFLPDRTWNDENVTGRRAELRAKPPYWLDDATEPGVIPSWRNRLLPHTGESPDVFEQRLGCEMPDGF